MLFGAHLLQPQASPSVSARNTLLLPLALRLPLPLPVPRTVARLSFTAALPAATGQRQLGSGTRPVESRPRSSSLSNGRLYQQVNCIRIRVAFNCGSDYLQADACDIVVVWQPMYLLAVWAYYCMSLEVPFS